MVNLYGVLLLGNMVEKVGDIFRSMKKTQNDEKGYERALGMNYDEIDKTMA